MATTRTTRPAKAPAQEATTADGTPVTEAVTKAVAKAKRQAKAAAPVGKKSVTRKDANLPADTGLVAGYFLRWPHPAFDLYKRNADGPVEAPLWVVRCNAHGETTTTDVTKEADRLGRKADRAVWCRGCKAEARKAAKAAASTK